jgi:hypothetical protein
MAMEITCVTDGVRCAGLHRRPVLRILSAAALLIATGADWAQAGGAGPIIGQWCGVEDYVISVSPTGVAFQPRRGYYSPPAFDVSVADDHAEYRQRYDSLDTTVSCRLTVEGTERATENCDNPDASVYPKAGDTAELHRCAPKPEPSV